jgi:hypothetical protein
MLCPSCKTKLIVDGQARLETLDEHVSAPNDEVCLKDKYICPNTDCKISSCSYWNEYGEFYCDKFSEIRKLEKDGAFINNNNGPFGSFQRKINVEIYKKDEEYVLFDLGKYRFEVTFNYKSNEDGDILKRKRHLTIWEKDENSGGYIYCQNFFHSLSRKVKIFHIQRGMKRTPDIFSNKRIQKGISGKLAYFYALSVNKLKPIEPIKGN